MVAGAQSAANIATAERQQQLNQVGSSGPYGSVLWQPDASQPGGSTQVTTLSPAQQQLLDQQQAVQNASLGVAGQQVGRVGQALGSGLDLNANPLQTHIGGDFSGDRQAMTDAVYNQYTSRLDPQWDQRQQQLETRLANQGISQNNNTYSNAEADFGRQRNDAYQQALTQAVQSGANEQNTGFNQSAASAQFANQARNQGLQEQAYVQNQPINQLSALLGMTQVQSPNGISYTPSQVAPTDVTGAYALNQAGQQANYNAAQQQQQGLMGGLFSLGSAALPFLLPSDRRLKRDIEHVGSWKGHRLYRYRYLWDDQPRLGVMADEVLHTGAVYDMGGWLAVDYGAL